MKRLAKNAPKTLEAATLRLRIYPEDHYQWIAGFVEADGCIHIGKSGGRNMKQFPCSRFHMLLTATQLDRRPMVLLQQTFGGKMQFVKRSGGRTYTQWVICANEAFAALSLLYPYLRFKKEQAFLAMELQKNINEQRGKWNRNGRLPEVISAWRRDLYFRCKELNSRAYLQKLNAASGEFGETLSEKTPSQAAEGPGSAEGVTTREVSPNNNLLHERPTPVLTGDEIV